MPLALLLLLAAPAGPPPFFGQTTVASHTDGYEHRWPCMATLADERVVVAWSRRDLQTNEDAIVLSGSYDSGCTWSPAEVVIANDGIVDADPSLVVSGERVFLMCTSVRSDGINTSAVWCVRSEDSGHTWSAPYEIPMNRRYTCGKCHRGLRLKSGTLVFGYSWDALCESGATLQAEGEMDLRAGVMRSIDNGETWTNGGDTDADYERVAGYAVSGTDEPAIVELDDGSLYMLMRTGSTHLYEARSIDEGLTWQGIQPSPLTGTNAPAALSAFDEAGRRGMFVVWDNAVERYPLCASASFDGGRTWSPPRDIGFPYTGGQASYPSCVQAPDGALLAVWQHDIPGGRDIRLARFNPAWLAQEPQTAADAGISIVAFGDSTTAPRGPLNTYSDWLPGELARLGVQAKVIKAGKGGNDTGQARERFENDVVANAPDVVIISFGINDSAIDVRLGETEPRISKAAYAANLRCFVEQVRAIGAKPILMTPNPIFWTPQLRPMYGKPPYDVDDFEGFNFLLREYAQAMRDLAAELDVPLVDQERILRDSGIPFNRLLLDGMHPNDVAHAMTAKAIAEVVNQQ